MSPTDRRSPWDVLRCWPARERVMCCIDLAPDAPRPGVLVGAAGQTRAVESLDPLASIRGAQSHLAGRERLAWLGYEAGGLIEPAAAGGRPGQIGDDWPLGAVTAFDRAVRFDAQDGRCGCEDSGRMPQAKPGFVLESFGFEAGRERYLRGVRRVLEYIRAGDVYQVNLTHRLVTRLHGSPRAFAAALFESARPWHGAYFETEGPDGRRRAVVSASPELFLDFDPASGVVRTRPMKGTRPLGGNAAELMSAEKDLAELNMIVDLMRNDLGRVCAFGSVRVDQARAIERHGTVLQATATVSGRVRGGLDLVDVLGAGFPPGSVTGTPKIRAMQIIAELEGEPRGPYCGCIGLIDRGGRARLNVAIRTALLTERAEGVWDVVFPVGAGIVADSEPEAEWRETLDKAAVLMGVGVMQAR